MIEEEMPSVMKKCEKRYRLSEFWFYEDMRDWVFYGTIDILWHNLMTEYGAFTPGKEYKCAEEVLAGLLHRGCNKENFYFPNIQKIMVRMENLSYVINKGLRCKAEYAREVPSRPPIAVDCFKCQRVCGFHF